MPLLVFLLIFSSCSHYIPKPKLPTISYIDNYEKSEEAKKDYIFLVARDLELNGDYNRSMFMYNFISDDEYIKSRMQSISDYALLKRRMYTDLMNPNVSITLEEFYNMEKKVDSIWNRYQWDSKYKGFNHLINDISE